MRKKKTRYEIERAKERRVHLRRMGDYLYGTSGRIPILEPEFVAYWFMQLPHVKRVEFNTHRIEEWFQISFDDGREPKVITNRIRPRLLLDALGFLFLLLDEQYATGVGFEKYDAYPRNELQIVGKKLRKKKHGQKHPTSVRSPNIVVVEKSSMGPLRALKHVADQRAGFIEAGRAEKKFREELKEDRDTQVERLLRLRKHARR